MPLEKARGPAKQCESSHAKNVIPSGPVALGIEKGCAE
jgi:hypothetical protein